MSKKAGVSDKKLWQFSHFYNERIEYKEELFVVTKLSYEFIIKSTAYDTLHEVTIFFNLQVIQTTPFNSIFHFFPALYVCIYGSNSESLNCVNKSLQERASEGEKRKK